MAHEGDGTAGALSAKNAYDLKLWRMPDGSYELVIFMKLQFFFKSGDTLFLWTERKLNALGIR